MRVPKFPWPGTATARGTLFFAQHLREMLSPSSFESFRALSLDSLTRAREAIQVIDDIQKEQMSKPALEPVLDEMAWAFEVDPALAIVFPKETDTLKATLSEKQTSLTYTKHLLSYIAHRLDTEYQKALEQGILAAIQDPNRRTNLLLFGNTYCSFLINKGFSRRYIEAQTEEVFFSRQLSRAGMPTIRKFFARFSAEAAIHTAYISVNDAYARHLRSLSVIQLHRQIQLPAIAQAALTQTAGAVVGRNFVELPMSALDPYAAEDRGARVLKRIRAIALLLMTGGEFAWAKHAYVIKRRAQSGLMIENADHIASIRASQLGGRSLRRLRRYTTRILNEFAPNSRARLLTSIETGVVARTSSSIEDAIVYAWSAFEIIFSDPEGARQESLTI